MYHARRFHPTSPEPDEDSSDSDEEYTGGNLVCAFEGASRTYTLTPEDDLQKCDIHVFYAEKLEDIIRYLRKMLKKMGGAIKFHLALSAEYGKLNEEGETSFSVGHHLSECTDVLQGDEHRLEELVHEAMNKIDQDSEGFSKEGLLKFLTF